MKTPIGGHTGMNVYEDNGKIMKVATDEENRRALRNEASFLKLFSEESVAPAFLEETEIAGEYTLWQEYIHGIPEERILKKNIIPLVVKFLSVLRFHNIRHADLTPRNFVITEDDIVAIDWEKAHFFNEDPPITKRMTSDSQMIWSSVSSYYQDRAIMRWLAITGDLGGWTGYNNLVGDKLLDLGCGEGSFCGMAAADGMKALGIDIDEGLLSEAGEQYGHLAEFSYSDIAYYMETKAYNHRIPDVILLLSVFPYLVSQIGWSRTDDIIRAAVKTGAQVYFETQLYGDGPGLKEFVDHMDVLAYLSQFGKVYPINSFPVGIRDATRSLWKVVL